LPAGERPLRPGLPFSAEKSIISFRFVIMVMRVIKVRSDKDISSAARRAARAIKAGKLVAFATETVYGVGALATDADALDRLRELKSRPKRPFSVHVHEAGEVARYVRELPFSARRLIANGFPGPLTLVVPVGGRLADAKLQRAGLYETLCQDDRIGLRCPDSPIARAILAAAGGPVVMPSANPAGKPSPRTGKDVLESLDGRIDLLVDSGATRYGRDSTIVRFNGEKWRIVRKGVLDARSIRKLMRFRLLIVCTGNTCRSPMAAALGRKILADSLGCTVSALGGRGVEVVSAGVFAGSGGRATPEAAGAVKKFGVDLSHHRSRKLTTQLINGADLVFCMTDFHVEEVRRLCRSAGEKVMRLDEKADISDPIGGGANVYGRTADRIYKAMQVRFKKVLP